MIRSLELKTLLEGVINNMDFPFYTLETKQKSDRVKIFFEVLTQKNCDKVVQKCLQAAAMS